MEAAAVTKYRVEEAERGFRSDTAEICFYYPQYTLQDAQDLPHGDRRLLLTYARLNRAELLQNLLQITVSTNKKSYEQTRSAITNAVRNLQKAL